jgi:hypothetical protein
MKLIKVHCVFITILVLMLSFASIHAQDNLVKELEPLQSFIGKTWKGEFSNSTTEKPMFDISRWERALNGTAIRVLHSVNNGEYGGESFIFWDDKKESLVYFYFTTGGFYTQGTMSIAGNQLISHEYVSGNENGITEVKAIGTILPDGEMKSESKYLQNGKWIEGHSIRYHEDPDAEVIFK